MRDARITDNAAEQRFEMLVDGGMAFVAYRRNGAVLTLDHAEVPAALEGHGVGSRLVKGTLDDVRSRGLKIVPRCSFIRAYLRRHPEYEDLLAK